MVQFWGSKNYKKITFFPSSHFAPLSPTSGRQLRIAFPAVSDYFNQSATEISIFLFHENIASSPKKQNCSIFIADRGVSLAVNFHSKLRSRVDEDCGYHTPVYVILTIYSASLAVWFRNFVNVSAFYLVSLRRQLCWRGGGGAVTRRRWKRDIHRRVRTRQFNAIPDSNEPARTHAPSRFEHDISF